MKLLPTLLVFALVFAGCVSPPEGAADAATGTEVSGSPPVSSTGQPAPGDEGAAPPASGTQQPAGDGAATPPAQDETPAAGDETINTTIPEEPQTNATNITEELPSVPQPPTGRLLAWEEEGKVLDGGISTNTLIIGGSYWMYYTGMGGIGLAQSSDGLHFTNRGVIFEGSEDRPGATNQAVIVLPDGTYRMLYEVRTGDERRGETETRKLYSAISSDGIHWRDEPGVRFYDYGEGNKIFTSVPDMLWFNNTLRMYYTVGLTSRIAVSTDNGLTWRKERNIDVEGVSLILDPDIIRLEDGTYKLFFTSFPSGDFTIGDQVIMSASSLDGLNFVPDEGIRMEISGPEGLLVDPDVVAIPGGYRMYYAKLVQDSSDVYSARSS